MILASIHYGWYAIKQRNIFSVSFLKLKKNSGLKILEKSYKQFFLFSFFKKST